MNPNTVHSIVLRPVGIGSAPTSQANDDFAAIQALIDQVRENTATNAQAGNAEAALRSLQSTAIDTSTTSTNSNLTIGAAVLLGLGGGILLGSIALIAVEERPKRRVLRGAR
jgi:hypothetical protein